MTNTLVIAFKNGDKMYIDGVESYEITTDCFVFLNHRFGYKTVLNFKEILYIGRKVDLEECKE